MIIVTRSFLRSGFAGIVGRSSNEDIQLPYRKSGHRRVNLLEMFPSITGKSMMILMLHLEIGADDFNS
jgi:hypothetical protein